MAGIQGIGAQGVGINNQGGVGGVDRLGLGGQQGGGSPLDQIKQLFQQLLERVLQGGGQAQGAQNGGQAQGAQNGGQAQGAQNGAEGIDELVRKLRELAQQNPEAFKQVLGQNPAFMAVAQAALSGGGGGGSIGKV
ncbi:hypothetical protein L6R52_09715 [Myxococcota bacterium]|nr:hypothetical protein [Myxococcota bacterium]